MTATELWNKFCSKFNIDSKTPYEAWSFGGAPDELADLVMKGIKTGTASAYDLYFDDEPEPVPKVGDYSVILDSKDNALCVICDTKVEIVPFDEVSEAHAFAEGEGDRSLAYWRDVHEEFFKNEFEGTKFSFHDKMRVLTEIFEVLYRVDED